MRVVSRVLRENLNVELLQVLNIVTLLLSGKEIFQCDVDTNTIQLMPLPLHMVAFVVYSPLQRSYILPERYQIDFEGHSSVEINFYLPDTRSRITPLPRQSAAIISIELIL